MTFKKIIPNIFYVDIKDGLKFFVDCLQFSISHHELVSHKPFYALDKDEVRVHLFENTKYANEHYPEFRLETNNIEEVYERISTHYPEFLHPNLKAVTLRPWGAKEFAIKDLQVCIIIQQWK